MTAPEPRGVPLGTLALTLAIQSLVSLVVYAMGVLIPLAYKDAGAAAVAVGVFTALAYGMSAFSAPVGGGFVARHGGLRVSQLCLLAAGIGGALCAVPHAWVGVLVALLIGVGYGSSTPSSAALLAERTPDRIRNLIMSIR